MKTKLVKEEPILKYESRMNCAGCDMCCPSNDINVYASDLYSAAVGTIWEVGDQDRCPNGSRTWTVSFEVVYRNDKGLAVLFKDENQLYPEEELIWVELAK